MSGAFGIALQWILWDEGVKVLISYSVPNNGNWDENPYDVNKIKSSKVVEDAMSEMDLDLIDLEKFRNSVTISGVIPDGSYQRLSMYYDILPKVTTEPESVLESLLSTTYSISRYIVEFDYRQAGLKIDDGLAFLNSLM